MIGVVSHDAGGSELLSAYLVEKQLTSNIKFYLKGPAVSIFQNQGLIPRNYIFDGKWDRGLDYLLLSMSWVDPISIDMIRQSKKEHIESEIMLDSWYDYAQRFGYPSPGWKQNLPTRITVVDPVAESIIYSTNLDKYCVIKRERNYYLSSIYELYNSLYETNTQCETIMYLSAPISEARCRGLRELSKTKTTQLDILSDISTLCKKRNTELLIRFHPSEDKKNICKSLSLIDCDYSVSDNQSILDDFSRCKFVIGYCSLALIQASVVGKISISYQKGDLTDIFDWTRYGVYSHYGVLRVDNINNVEDIIDGRKIKDMCPYYR